MRGFVALPLPGGSLTRTEAVALDRPAISRLREWNAWRIAMQNLVSLNLAAADLTALDGALATIEKVLARGIADAAAAARPDEAGHKSEAFRRQSLTPLVHRPPVVPPSLGVVEAQVDLAAVDVPRPQLDKLHQLTERADDTEPALGSDLMGVALEGYALPEGKASSL